MRFAKFVVPVLVVIGIGFVFRQEVAGFLVKLGQEPEEGDVFAQNARG